VLLCSRICDSPLHPRPKRKPSAARVEQALESDRDRIVDSIISASDDAAKADDVRVAQHSFVVETVEQRLRFGGDLWQHLHKDIDVSARLSTTVLTPTAELRVRDDDFFVRVASRADVGFAEAYIAGEIDSPDMLQVLKYMIALRDSTAARLKQRESLGADWRLVASTAALGVLSTVGRATSYVYHHWSRRNSTANTRANIHAHYDLGNDFFRLFLDGETMAYSCAAFDEQHNTLETAQVNKFERLHRLLQLDRHERKRVLEVGNGWGTLSILIAQAGHAVTGLTLSSEQQRFVRDRAKALGLEDRVQTLLQDYRMHVDDAGYDGIVSCEMLEAVGHEFLPAFFRRMEALLKPGGRLVLQVIVTPDHRYERYRRHADFIQLYVFPGGLCPSLGAISEAMQGTQLAIEQIDSIGPDYARTLREWRERFEQQLSQVRALGFDESFVRLWRYYLMYCEAAFETRTMNVVQIAMRKHR
jgi:cyclopropane-fatty-acyl-phospholipid synthase